MVKAIIFDFGGVLLDLSKKPTLNIPQALAILFEIPIEEAVVLWRANRENVVIGQETPQQFLKEINKLLKSNKSVDRLYQQWKILSRKEGRLINWDLLTFIKDLREHKTTKVYVLSDAVNIAQDDKLTKEIQSKFDGFFVSYKEGFKKSTKEAFLNVLSKIAVNPQNCVFVDDTIDCILIAESLGIKSFQFTTFNKLKKDLASIGIS